MRIVTFLLILPFFSFGQDLKIYHKVVEDSLYLTWVNKSTIDWRITNERGYQLKIVDDNNVTILDETILNSLSSFANLSNQDDRKFLYALVYNENLAEDLYGASVLEEESFEDVEEQLLENFYFIAAREFKLLEAIGWAVKIPISNNRRYSVQLQPNGIDDRNKQIFTNIVPSEYKTPTLPKLESSWKNKSVELQWSHAGFTDTYQSYDLFFSEDGKNWNKTDTTIVNFYPEGSPQELLEITFRKQLPNNDTLYYFKLHGIDFFGDESELFSMVVGSGSKGIQVSPFWDSVRQLKTNKAHLKWKIPEESAQEVEEFRIYVSETYDGTYYPDTIGVSPKTRELKREIPFRSAYFRVVAVDRNEEEYSSFPQLVISVDTLAPEVPQNLSYEIDTTGKINITWDPNEEEDFIGYKLFYCYDTTVDMTLAHNSYLINPSFEDTLELRSTNRNVYYKAISVDKRNNRSDFSKVLIVRRPDILAPVEPVFLSAKGGPGSAELLWYESISDDVKEQRLFRRKIGEDESWTLLEIWDSQIDTSYLDTDLEAFSKYSYTLTVIDTAGNISDAARPVIAMPTPDYRGFDLEKWQAELSNDDVQITHDFDPSIFEKVFIYRKIEDGDLYLLGELQAKEFRFLDEDIVKDKIHSYAIKVMFKEGIETSLSNFKEIKI